MYSVYIYIYIYDVSVLSNSFSDFNLSSLLIWLSEFGWFMEFGQSHQLNILVTIQLIRSIQTYQQTHICTYFRIHICTHICMYPYTNIYIYIYVYVLVRRCCTYIYIYIHIHIPPSIWLCMAPVHGGQLSSSVYLVLCIHLFIDIERERITCWSFQMSINTCINSSFRCCRGPTD